MKKLANDIGRIAFENAPRNEYEQDLVCAFQNLVHAGVAQQAL